MTSASPLGPLAVLVNRPLRQDPHRCERLLDLLDDGEVERYRHMPSASAAGFVIGRALARRLLGLVMHVDPQSIVISSGPYGRPRLVPQPSLVPGLDFNVSHCPGYTLVGITIGGTIGVDVESINRFATEVAARFFLPEELERLERVSPALRAGEFTRVWTVKEACAKSLGIGLSTVRRVRVTSGSRGRWEHLHWQTRYLSRRAVAAIAVSERLALPATWVHLPGSGDLAALGGDRLSEVVAEWLPSVFGKPS